MDSWAGPSDFEALEAADRAAKRGDHDTRPEAGD